MDPAEELKQITTWLHQEGLEPGSPTEAQLRLMWRALQRTRSRLSSVTSDLEAHRSQHSAEMAEVRKSLGQIRIFTEHKDVLAQEIQDENDQLKEQMRRLVSLQDAQISEVAKMLYQQGLTELIHSSPSEQVAYLLVERASLLETAETPAGNTEVHVFSGTVCQSEAGPGSRLERECCRLERDVEEGSRRLAMAHTEIRRLTDELESAHMTQKTYEPELAAAQQEVEQLRHQVEKLKKYEMVELRKVKELNDRLDLESRTFRGRVRCLDAENSKLQQRVASLQEEVKRLEQQLVTSHTPTAQKQEGPLQPQKVITEQFQADGKVRDPKAEPTQSNQMCRDLQEKINIQTKHLLQKDLTVESLQKKVELLKAAVQEQQQQLITVQLQADRAAQLAESRSAELIQSSQTCRDLQNTVRSLQQQLENSHNDLENLITKVCTRENGLHNQKMWKQQTADSRLCEDFCKLKNEELNEENKQQKERLEDQEAVKTLWSTRDECETLKEEICETLKHLDKEQSKYHEMKERHKAKLCRAKQKFSDVTALHNEKINRLQRELSLCSHSLAKEKELVKSMNAENEKLLSERRRLIQQLDEEEHSKKDLQLSAGLSRRRVDFLEVENKKLGNKVLQLSDQLGVLQRSQQNRRSLHFAEELKKILILQHPALQTSSVSDGAKRGSGGGGASPPHRRMSGSFAPSAEMGYLNLTTQCQTDPPSMADGSQSESTLC
ncbi:coiled-coil domain-containing protein 30 isoform X1 [Salarias fasciatus]|uniref:coiled-coil domain-containing protein 30 isoform X1 n=1 Tax=Salarias fasciatus TaxID=181472 RepID=UPI0011764BCB|nr:coiled-coil domain-containing protein 30-like isoform X1 [Salarias fasciatus]